jgi:hypothetical protein
MHVLAVDPVVLKKLINRDWHTGEPVSVYDLDDYEERWGYVSTFHSCSQRVPLAAQETEAPTSPAKSDFS